MQAGSPSDDEFSALMRRYYAAAKLAGTMDAEGRLLLLSFVLWPSERMQEARRRELVAA